MQKIAGWHLLVDGYVHDRESLEPQNLIRLFDRLVDVLGMQYLTRTVVAATPIDDSKLDTDQDEGGWSAYAMITTSHISLHAWPLRRAFMMDIFSCRPFEVSEAIDTVNEELGVDKWGENFVRRLDPVHDWMGRAEAPVCASSR